MGVRKDSSREKKRNRIGPPWTTEERAGETIRRAAVHARALAKKLVSRSTGNENRNSLTQRGETGRNHHAAAA